MSNGAKQTAQQALRPIGLLDPDAINLCEAALWFAKWAEPSLRLDVYRRHLETLVRAAQDYVATDIHDDNLVLEAAQQVVSRRYGYGPTSNTPAHIEDFSLADTIDHRRGDSMILAMLYRHVLIALGRTVEIIAFAPRALVAVYTKGGRVLLDPCAGGRLVTARDLRQLLGDHRRDQGDLSPDQLISLDPRQILLSLQHEIKTYHLRHTAPEAALLAVEGALLVAPNDTRLWRELGLLHMRLDHVGDAMVALERFLQLPGSGPHRYTASQLLQQLRQRLEHGEL